jgi:cytochrome P450
MWRSVGSPVDDDAMPTAGPAFAGATGSLAQDLALPEIHHDPYPYYDWLRRERPMYQTPYGAWVVSRHADAIRVLRDSTFSSNSFGNNENFVAIRPMLEEQLGIGELLRLQERAMLFLDPPDHTRLRRLVSKAFSTRAVDALRPRADEVVAGLLDDIDAKGEMDVITDLAYPLPITMICEMIGVPLADRELFEQWTPTAVKVLDPSDDFSLLQEANEAITHFVDYFRDLIASRRRAPGDDLLSGLIAAEDEGDRLTEQELLSTLILLLIAGHETTVNLIGNGMLALLRHPDELARLRREPALMGSAVDELLRYDSPVQLTSRTALADQEVAGVPVAKGSEVIVLLGAANRDPDQFADPTRLDIGRADRNHIAFGGGIHVCLGAPLARLEGRSAIGGAVGRWSDLELLDDDPGRKDTITLRGLTSLRVAVRS